MVLHNPVLTGMRVFPGFVASNFTNNYMKSVHTWLCARAMQLEYLVGIKHKTDKHCQFLLYLNAIQNCGSSEKLHIFCMQVIHTEAEFSTYGLIVAAGGTSLVPRLLPHLIAAH